MSEQHGAAAIKEWMQDLVELARSGRPFETSGGAEPHRSYAYMEFRVEADAHHSMLLLRVEDVEGRPEVRAYRFDGNPVEVRERVDALTHSR